MRAEQRLVLDTNVVVSGLIAPTSAPGRVIDHAVLRGHLIATGETMAELIARLMSPKFDRWLPIEDRQATLDRLIPLVEIVEVVRVIRACRDPKDDKFLEAAVNGSANMLVTGDKDLLVLNPFSGIAIVAPAQYLEQVAG